MYTIVNDTDTTKVGMNLASNVVVLKGKKCLKVRLNIRTYVGRRRAGPGGIEMQKI